MHAEFENTGLEQSRFIPWGWEMSPEGHSYQKEDKTRGKGGTDVGYTIKNVYTVIQEVKGVSAPAPPPPPTPMSVAIAAPCILLHLVL